MKRITLLITLCLLCIGGFEAFAQKNGEIEPIYHSEAYDIYTPNYKSSTVSKPIRTIVQIEKSDKKVSNEKKQKKVKKPARREKNMLLGLNVSAGFDRLNFMYTDKGRRYNSYLNEWYSTYKTGNFTDYSYKMSFSLDLAYPITKGFGLGFYIDNGFCYLSRNDMNYAGSIGLLTTFGNYHDSGAAFIFGIGYEGTRRFNSVSNRAENEFGHDDVYGINDINSLDIRLGVLFNNGLYITTDMSTDCSDKASFSMTFGIGYNFGALFKVK